jgi:DNA-binding NtrC family response regulator
MSTEMAAMPTLDDLERQAIGARMLALQGNKPEVAASLGISLKTLYNRLNRYALDRPFQPSIYAPRNP